MALEVTGEIEADLVANGLAAEIGVEDNSDLSKGRLSPPLFNLCLPCR
jgi:hypothetical protein